MSSPISGRLLFRVGIALVLVGMLLLFRHTFDRFGPLARLSLGAVASAGLVAAGILVPRRFYGRLMQGAGVAGGYITAWAAHGVYGLVEPTAAFVQMSAVALAGVGLAWRERSDVLSALGLVGAVASPLLVGGTFTAPIGELTYQVMLLVLAAALYLRFAWFATLAVTVVGSGLVIAVEAASGSELVLAAVAVWWLTGWAVPVLGPQFRPDGWAETDSIPYSLVPLLTLPVPVASWAFVWAVDGRPAVMAGVAGVLALIHTIVWWRERSVPESAVQLFAAVGFAAFALLSWFDVPAAIPLFLLVTVGLAVWGSRAEDEIAVLLGMLLSAPALAAWFGVVTDTTGFDAGPALRDLVSVALVAGAAVLGRGLVSTPATVAAFTMALFWNLGHLGQIDPGWATAGLAAVGIVSLIAGRIDGSRPLTGAGLVTLAVTVAKLVFVDLASADPILKIGLSLGIGMALLGVGYWVGDRALLGESSETEDEQTENPAQVEAGR